MATLAQPEYVAFLSAAREFCEVVERPTEGDAAGWARSVEAALLRAYLAASLLPDVPPDSEQLPPDLPGSPSRDLAGSISKTLGPHDVYQELYDPTDATDTEPVSFLVSLDLAEIYDDLRRSVYQSTSGLPLTENDIVWEWKFSHTQHWARHAMSALRVLGLLIREYRLTSQAPGG